jgi:ABC-type sugar transport system ATPase subunit
MDGSLLRMRAISKTFPGVKALSGVDLDVTASRVHALIGKNGAGKSTLIKILGGVHRPDSGEIEITGEPVHFSSPSDAQAKGVAIVHQELSLVPGLTVAENILLGRWNGWVDWSEMNRRARESLAELDADIPAEAVVSQLSIAQRQIVEIAKALAQKPRILVLDEPTSALSEPDAERLLTLIRRLAAQQIGIVYISHRLGEVEAIADEITVLRDGRTVASGPASEFDRVAIVSHMLGAGADLKRDPRPAGSEIAMRVENLDYDGAAEPVSFTLHRGEILGIAGLMGAGRTELLRALFGADPVRGGHIVLNGETIRKPNPRRMRAAGMAFLPEDRKGQALVLGLSVADNMALTMLGKLRRGLFIDPARHRDMVDAQFRDLHIAAANPDVPVGTLSGGNQQKVVLGKWLATSPRVLLLDEPTRGVDVGAKAQIFKILEQLAAEGLAIILVSSEIEEVLTMSHRILTMARGRIVSDRPAHQSDMADIMLSATG